MVFIQPTTYALINITDFPFFVVPLNEIEHVHFERVFSSSKTCDLKIIMKVRPPQSKAAKAKAAHRTECVPQNRERASRVADHACIACRTNRKL